MSAPKVLIGTDVCHITLYRNNINKTLIFLNPNILIIRTTDDRDEEGYPDENGYYYFISATPLGSSHSYIYLDAEEAQSIVEQIFEITGQNVCDF
jgi:hypothetical protein